MVIYNDSANLWMTVSGARQCYTQDYSKINRQRNKKGKAINDLA